VDLSAAVVTGTVRRADQTAVIGASVSVFGFAEGCSGNVLAEDARVERPFTAADGSYSLLLQSPLAPRTVCVMVRAVSPSKADTVVVSGATIPLRVLTSSTLDTLVVNLVLP
jgi:hypothetical protein